MLSEKNTSFKDSHSILYRLCLVGLACLIIAACVGFYAKMPKLLPPAAVDALAGPTRSSR